MSESFCILCNNQEFSKLPNGKIIKHKTVEVNEILCSTCTQFCMAKSLQEPPWEGRKQMQEMIDARKNRKLKTRRK